MSNVTRCTAVNYAKDIYENVCQYCENICENHPDFNCDVCRDFYDNTDCESCTLNCKEVKINRITREELDAIRERCDAATPEWATPHTFNGVVSDSDIDIVYTNKQNKNFKNDVRFISHARQDIPALLSEIDRLTALADAVRMVERKPDRLDAIRERAKEAGTDNPEFCHVMATIEEQMEHAETLLDKYESERQSKEGE